MQIEALPRIFDFQLDGRPAERGFHDDGFLAVLQRIRDEFAEDEFASREIVFPEPVLTQDRTELSARLVRRLSRLREAALLLPWSPGALQEAPVDARRGNRALVLPVPVEPSGPPPPARDIAAITYAANPVKKGLDRVLSAWRRLRGEGRARAGEQLLVAGASAEQLERAGFQLPDDDGVRVAGALEPEHYRALVRRARLFVCAPRREDYGLAQLEALADGCMLVTTPAPGPYAALPIARALDPRLVSDDLEGALRAALDAPLPDYAPRAAAALSPFSREAVDRLVAGELLARLLA